MRRAAIGLAILGAALAAVAGALAAPAPLALSLSSANGSGVAATGASCADGGEGSSWHYGYQATIAGGAFSSLPATAALALDLHSDAPGTAWLLGDQSTVTLANARGTVRLALTSGTCDVPTLSFDGTTAAGAGTWAVDATSGSYRQATGSGTFSLRATVGPGAQNPFALDLNGAVAVLEPDSRVEVADAAWAPHRGAREAVVTMLVANDGPGDAYGVTVESGSSPDDDVSAATAFPVAVGDVPAGGSTTVVLRFALEKGPCPIVEKGCAFDASLVLRVPNALDVATAQAHSLRIRIPS